MAGLLDMFVADADPVKNAQFKRGLLDFGLNMLAQGGRRTGEAIGRAGLLTADMRQQREQQEQAAKRAALQDQMLQGQLAQQQHQQRMQALPGQFMRADKPASMDNRDVGQPGEQPLQPSLDVQGYQRALMGLDPVQGLQFQQMTQKAQPKPIQLGANERLLHPESFKEMVPALPDQGKQSSLAQLMGEMNALPPGHPARALYMDAIRKATTHQPGVQVSYGTGSTPMQAPDGSIVLGQLSSKPGVPMQVVTDPKTGKPMRPPPQDRDVKLPAELQRMQIAGDAMGSLLNNYEAMLKKHNPRDPSVQMNPALRAEMQSLKRNLELQFKELQALGALAGPDIDIMRQALADPFSMAGAYYGRDGLLAQVGQARELIKLRKDAVMSSQGRPAAASAPPAASAAEVPVRRFNPATGRIE